MEKYKDVEIELKNIVKHEGDNSVSSVRLTDFIGMSVRLGLFYT